MLIWLGVRVEHASLFSGDNLVFVQNATNKVSLLKNKHVADSYHKSRETVVAAIVHLVKAFGENNFEGVLTNTQTLVYFSHLVGAILHG